MTARPPTPGATAPASRPQPAPADRRTIVAAAVAIAVFGLLAAGLVVLVALAANGSLPAAAVPSDPRDFAYAEVRDAPPLQLTDQDGQAFTLASLRGRPVLVFFGYTHCPDVCPETIGILGQALAAADPGPRALFVSIDPARDDVAAMKQYVHYLSAAFTGLTGTPDEVRRNAAAWDVHYAKVDEGSGTNYGMSHTADVFLVDAEGHLRAKFPFGTPVEPITASLDALLAETPGPPDGSAASASGATAGRRAASPSPATLPSPAAPAQPSEAAGGMGMGGLQGTVVSSSVWAGGRSPVILSITDPMGMPLDGTTPISVRLVGPDGQPVGADMPAVAIRPSGEQQVSYVATVDIPTPGSWRLDLLGPDGASGSVTVDALDQGGTARLGSAAPDVDTPTLDDVGGNLLAISTLPQADARLYQTSTADARAAGRPYVLVVDSARFKVSPACGRALSMIRFLLDRWTDVSFIHLEPFEYQIVTGEPVLSGDIATPPLNRNARAFGLGDATWPATSMPWIFVVDGLGIVRAKYTGIVGSADVDLILSLITGEGVIGR